MCAQQLQADLAGALLAEVKDVYSRCKRARSGFAMNTKEVSVLLSNSNTLSFASMHSRLLCMLRCHASRLVLSFQDCPAVVVALLVR
jgi:hypothetical protein